MGNLRGTAASDTLFGTALVDSIYGDLGNDVIRAGAGNDYAEGNKEGNVALRSGLFYYEIGKGK